MSEANDSDNAQESKPLHLNLENPLPDQEVEENESEDEGMEDYKLGGYHPVHIGLIFIITITIFLILYFISFLSIFNLAIYFFFNLFLFILKYVFRNFHFYIVSLKIIVW
jgi:hypothetical protein